MTRSIALLGSTGSIGRQTLEVARELGLSVAALTANKSVDLIEQQAREFCPRLAVLYDEDAARELRARLSDTNTQVLSGMEGLLAAATADDADTVVTAVMGMIGLQPTLAAIEKKKRIALANKETLVCAGELVVAAAERCGAEIVPVDSEHSAIFQCLQGCRDRGEVRRLLLNVDLLMLFWILVRTLRFQLNTPPEIDRMLGYLYYAPMLGIPVLCVQLVLTVDRSERYRLSAWARMLWLPSAVLLELVLTNDLHQQVFRLQQPWNENYQYGWLFGLVVGWIVICILLAFGIIAHKSRNPRILRRLPLPAIPLVLLGIYAVLYGFHFPLIRQFLGDMTIVHCLMTAASLEGGLRCGLIQSNTGYEELLRVTSLAVQLVDRQGNVYCCSENGRMVDRRELQAAMNGTVQLDEHTLLRSAPVQGGYVMWQTDITELVENMERLKENRTELAERNYLEQQNYEAERKTNALREKNRLYDLLQRRLAPQIIRMDQLLTRYRTAPEADRRQLLGQVAVLGAYLKRGANLMFLAQKHRYVPSAELRYALEESISSLELAGVECAMEVTQGVRLPAEAAAACYSRFESVVEGALGQLDALFVRAIWKDHQLNLYLSVETGADLKAVCPAAVQEAPGSWVLNDHFEGGAPECGTN